MSDTNTPRIRLRPDIHDEIERLTKAGDATSLKEAGHLKMRIAAYQALQPKDALGRLIKDDQS